MKRKKNSTIFTNIAAAHTYRNVVKSDAAKYVIMATAVSTINNIFNIFLTLSMFIASYFTSFSLSAFTTSSGSGTIPPNLPKYSTGTLHSTARRTSSTI